MSTPKFSLLLWLLAALLLLLVWLTTTGRLGSSRHGYAAAAVVPDTGSPRARRS